MQVANDSLQADAVHVLSGMDDAVRSESEVGISVRISTRTSSRTRSSHKIHSAVKDKSQPTAQYIVHSDLTKVQARQPWARASTLYGQVCIFETLSV